MVGKRSWIKRSPGWVAGSLLALAAAGCAAEAGEEPVTVQVASGNAQPSIFGGAKDDSEDANASVVALRVGTGGTFELCTGAVVAPNVILTARHCVTKNVTTSVSCDENGQSANGKHVAEDEDLGAIGIYVGAAPSFGKTPTALARAIVSPAGPYLCDSDIALVVLDRALENVKPLPIRIHGATRAGETIRSIGYGQNDSRAPIGTRFRKDGVSVLAQGRAVSPSKTPLGIHEFEVGRSICQGDSGGPAISEETGAVIGVVSRGGKCDEDFGHIYTTTSGFEKMFAKAFEIAEATPILEEGDAAPRASTTSAKSAAPASAADDAPANAASCSASPRGDLPAGAAFGIVAVAAALLTSRRRRAS